MSETNFFEYGLQDDADLTITLTLDDDSELECAVVAIFPVQNKDYIALLPLGTEDDKVYLYRFKHNKDTEFELENIEDDEEFELVADAYDTLLMDAEDEEEIYEDL